MTTETLNNITIEQPIKIKDRLEIFEIEVVPSCPLNKRKRGPTKGKYITSPWRYKEDGTYDNKPLSKNYFNDYYRDHCCSDKIKCSLCGREVVKKVLRRHQGTHICKQIQDINIV